MGNSDRTEQSPLDGVLSSRFESKVCVLCLLACVLGDHRINVYIHH